MSMSDPLFWTFFYRLFESIPRQGPGLDDCTAEALSLIPPLRPDQRILDIGCGAGLQTLELARHSVAPIIATDIYEPFLARLTARAKAEGLDARLTTQVADMGALPFPDRHVDLLWAEGCSFILGFPEALRRWHRLLVPGGHLVLSEFTWPLPNPPDELHAFVFGDSPEDASLEGRRLSIREAGYALVTDFALPAKGWRDTYYGPLAARLDDFLAENKGEPMAKEVVERCRYELDLYRRYPEHFGYRFFVLKR